MSSAASSHRDDAVFTERNRSSLEMDDSEDQESQDYHERFLTVQTSISHSQDAGQESREEADGHPRRNQQGSHQAAQPGTPTTSSSPSNERLLGIAFVSFMSFSLTQLFFATRAGSHAMLGDSAAMIVDALTYLFNWMAERRKNRFTSTITDPRKRQRAKRKLILQLEIIPPILSVTVLVAVTIVVTGKAVEVLSTPEKAEKIPDLALMMLFSIFNLVLDGLNVFCFSKSTENLGIRPEVNMSTPTSRENAPDAVKGSCVGYDRVVDLDKEHEDEGLNDDDDNPNLNMCSAFTHVFADTLRSLAVILAAAIGLNVSSVEPDKADAVAAIVVSLLIAVSLLPLIQGLRKSAAELRAILAEESSENMFSGSEDELELT